MKLKQKTWFQGLISKKDKQDVTYSKQTQKTCVYHSTHVDYHVHPAAWAHTRVLQDGEIQHDI